MSAIAPVQGIATLALEGDDQPCIISSEDGYEAVVMPILI